jgi:flagellin
MTSINFNASATTALRTLQQTNSALETSQNRVSTGLKIGEAKDNAAYWSISTTLKSDNKALATVKDALGLGAATVDTAYQGLNKALEVLDQIKSKLTAATQDGVDKVAVQAEIVALKDQLSSIASSASFSGENWLSYDGSVAGSSDKKVVSSFNRLGAAVTIGTIDIDISTFALVDTRASEYGVIEGSATASVDAGTLSTAIGAANTTTGTYAIVFGANALSLDKSDLVTFDINVAATGAKTVAIDQELVNKMLNVTDGKIRNVDEFKVVMDEALKIAGVTTTSAATTATNTLTLTGMTSIAVTGEAAVGKGGVLGIDITGKTRAEIVTMINSVVTATNSVTTAAASLGAVSSRIEMQTTFVDTLIDTIDKGVSDLIDADLSEESTRLQALQTKQQLGIQALSIANTSTQNILSLFRS